MSDSLVSIIIPVYQKVQYIEKCIHSLINQNYKNIEILLIDDGSTDGSEVICDKLAEEYNFIRTIHQNNRGVSSARNKGIKNATGEYILFLDCDDFIENDILYRLIKLIEETKTDICIFDFIYFNEKRHDIITTSFKSDIYSKRDIVEYFWAIFEKRISHNVGNKIYKSKIIKDNNILFNEEYSIFEDILFFLEYLNNVNKIYYLNEPLYYYYSHDSGSLRTSYKKKFFKAHIDVYNQIEKFLNNNLKFDQYSEKFYKNYMYGISEALINECSNDNKDKLNKVIDDIVNDTKVKKSKMYINSLNLKQKLLYSIIWSRRKRLLYILIKIFMEKQKFNEYFYN